MPSTPPHTPINLQNTLVAAKDSLFFADHINNACWRLNLEAASTFSVLRRMASKAFSGHCVAPLLLTLYMPSLTLSPLMLSINFWSSTPPVAP